MNNNISVKQILSGEDAFYNQPDYEVITRQEMQSQKALNPIYTYNTESKVWRVAKDIFAVIIFPIGLYRLLHSLLGKIIVQASSPSSLGYRPDHAYNSRNVNFLVRSNDLWKVKRISVEVDGYTIDAVITGTAATLGNGRWALFSHGNGEFYEDKFDRSFKHILSQLNGNAIIFNYPGVECSTGMPNRSAMAKAYRAILNFMEDQEKGIGAKEIIGIGHSIGGGVQGDALLSHKLKDDVKYVFVKSRTFSDMSITTSLLTNNRLLGFLVKVFGWNISSVESSKNLKAPEIILQTAGVSNYTDISGQPEKIISDGVIPAEASLAKKLLDEQKEPFPGNKYFMGITEDHNQILYDSTSTELVAKINEMLLQQNA